MKKILTLMIAAAVVFAGCDKKSDDDGNGNGSGSGNGNGSQDAALSIDKATINAAYTAGSYSVAVTSNTTWTAAVSADATWCTVSPASGTGNGTVAVNVAENPSLVERAATVTIAAGLLSQAVAVAQDACPPPQYAASTQTWTIGEQTWSDAIQIPACDKTSFTDSNTDPHCRSYTYYNKKWYYYNWPYVSQNAVQLCPSPWRVPTNTDFCNLDKALFSTTTCTWRSGVPQSDITDKYVTAWGGTNGGTANGSSVYGMNSDAYYWSSTAGGNDEAYLLFFSPRDYYVVPQNNASKLCGFQVRCVK
jgi:uncharacterized protein (TIGR02145 family)